MFSLSSEGLIGEQYGDACLPEQIEASEFQSLLQACQRMNLKCEILERCYQRDENVIPPSFCLGLNPSEHTKPHSILARNLFYITGVQKQVSIYLTSLISHH